MKRTLKSICAAAALGVALSFGTLGTVSILTGCSTTASKEQTAYKTMKTVADTANLTLDGWQTYAIKKEAALKKIADPAARDVALNGLRQQEEQVAAIYEKFRAAYKVALTTAKSNVNELAPADVTALSSQLFGVVSLFIGETE